MKAAILDGYDKSGATLAVRDIPVPEPASHEVLVRVHTAAVNPLDNMIVRGEVRLIVPYRTPLVMGNEFSGTVMKAGSAAGRFEPGDRVYGRMPLARALRRRRPQVRQDGGAEGPDVRLRLRP